MPYIKEKKRGELELFASQISNIKEIGQNCLTTGELNYSITKVLLGYLETKEESYQTYNDIVGVLECCKQELYRRKISVYENKKIIENGDVF